MNTPLTEADFDCSVSWIKAHVQSAKRLLKAQLQDRLYPADADDIVDACFQIDDGDDDE